MSIISTHTARLPTGVVLDTRLDGELIHSYVVISPPDLNAIADIVPQEQVDAGGDIHATAISDADSAYEQASDVLDNINPGDIAVFLCGTPDAYEAALQVLGYDDPAQGDDSQ
jgi:hypothetical protein